jgi:cytochrome c oxidase subunit 2
MISLLFCDYPLNWSTGFQDPASASFYQIIDLHDQVVFYIFIILVVVFYFMIDLILSNGQDLLINLRDSERLELAWTIAPAILLWLIAIPSLYSIYL